MTYTYMDSPFTGPYYQWFCDLGYPQCDLHVFESGEWAILEMINAPVVPSLTQWRWIAKGFRNIEPNQSRVKRILEQIDPRKRWIWELEEKRSQELEAQQNAREERAEELATEWTDSVVRNPDLMERIAKNGAEELLPHKIAENIPDSKLKGV